MVTAAEPEKSVIVPTTPRGKSINSFVAFVLVLKVAAIPAVIVDEIVDAVPILINVFPIETTGALVSFPVMDKELPAETFDTESTKITVEPIATVCPVVVAVVRKLTFAVSTDDGAVRANATLLLI